MILIKVEYLNMGFLKMKEECLKLVKILSNK